MYVLMPHMRATSHNGSCFRNRTVHTCDNGQNGLNTPRNITLIASLHVSCATPCVQPAHRKSNTESTRHCYTSEFLASVLASEAYGVTASTAALWSEPSIRRVSRQTRHETRAFSAEVCLFMCVQFGEMNFVVGTIVVGTRSA